MILFSPNLISCARVLVKCLYHVGYITLVSALLIFAHFLGKTSRFLCLLLNCRYGPMMLQHPRISINIHPHVTRCAIRHFFTAYSPKLLYFYAVYLLFFHFVCGRWFSRYEKENSKLPLTLTLKYIYSTSGLVDNGNRFNWFRTIQNYTGLWATSTSSEPVCHDWVYWNHFYRELKA